MSPLRNGYYENMGPDFFVQSMSLVVADIQQTLAKLKLG